MNNLKRISSACMANTTVFLFRRYDRSSPCFGNRLLSVHFLNQRIFYFFPLAYFNPNIVHSFAVTNVNFNFLCLCCKAESFNLCFFKKSKKSCIHFSSIQTAILLLVIITGASIVTDFLPDRAIIYLFALPRYVFHKVGTDWSRSVVQRNCQHLS